MAKDWRRPNEAARKHWKQREAGQTSTAARGVKRIVFTILSVVLLGVLIWFLIPRGQRVYVAYLSEDYGPALRNPTKVEVALLAPPLAASGSVYDKEFAPLGMRLFPKQFTIADVASSGNSKLAAQELVESLTAPIRDKWNLDSVEFLVLYVNAHGIAIDGVPYLMWNEDYSRELSRTIDGKSQSELMKLDDVIAQVRKLPAKQKLLVLDGGRIYADPRLGFFVNEFPKLAEEKIAATGDEKLWAFTSHSVMEQARVFAADRTSVFGHFIGKGIAGASLPSDDEDLTLRDFVTFVSDKVTKTVSDRTGELQTPRFINGNLGVLRTDDIPDMTFLKSDFFDRSVEVAEVRRGGSVWSSAFATLALAQNAAPVQPAAQPSTAQPPVTQPPAAQPPAGTAQPGVIQPGAVQPGAAQGQTPPATNPPTTSPPVVPADAAPKTPPAVEKPKSPSAPISFDEVWNLVVEIEDPAKLADAWSPVDYAPHLWSQLRRQLTWYEITYALESGELEKNSAFIEKEIVTPLKQVLLRDGDQVTMSPVGAIEVFGDLQQARAAFRKGAAYASASSTQDSVQNFVRAVRLKNYLTFRAAEEVRYYGFSPDTSADRYEALSKVIEELSASTTELEKQAKASLDESYWIGNLGLPGRLRDAKALLGSDELHRQLFAMGTIPAEPLPVVVRAKPRDITDRQLANWVKLYLALARLSAPTGTGQAINDVAAISPTGAIDPALGGYITNIRNLTGKDSPPLSDHKEYWKAYRAIGLQVRAYFDGLDDSLKTNLDKSASTNSYDALCHFERVLRLVDGRDAPGMSLKQNTLAQRALCPRVAPRIEFALADKTISLPPPSSGRAGRKSIAPAYRWSGEIDTEATVRVEFDNPPAAAKVVKVIVPTQSFDLRAEGTLPEIAFEQSQDRLNKTNTELVSFRLIVSVDDKDVVSPGSGEMVVAAHGSELVNLAAYRVRKEGDVPIENRKDGEFAIELAEPPVTLGNIKARLFQINVQAFPNRPDQYRFKLTSVSGATVNRDVAVDLFEVAIPLKEPLELIDQRGELELGHVRELSQFHRELNLSANSPVTFPFIEQPKPMAEGAAKPADAPAAAPAPAEGEKPKNPPPIADFRRGMVFRITDKNNAYLRWYYWVSFQARHPDAYVNSTVTYDGDRGRLEIKITPDQKATQPADGISGSWSLDGVTIDPQLSRTMEVVKKQKDEVRLNVNNWFPPELQPGTYIPLFISVDGYPRALVHEFTPTVDADVPLRQTRSLQRAKIVEPPRDLFAYKKDKPGEVRVNIGIELDGQPSNKALLLFGDGNNTQWDTQTWRAQHVLLEEKGWDKEGALTLTTTAGDFVGADAIPFDTTQTETLIPVELQLKSGELTPKEDKIQVVVDEQEPAIDAMSDPDPQMANVKKGLEVAVTPTVNDRGGVARVEFFIFPDSKTRLLDEDQKKPDFVWTPPAQEKEKLGPPIMEPTPIRVKIPFGDKTPGRWVIWAVAVNQVDRRSLPMRTTNPLDLEEAKKETPPEMGPGITITGYTMLYGDPAIGMTVKLIPLEKGKGKPQSSATADPTPQDFIDNAGPYKFEKVQPGKYKITAKGSTKKSPHTFVGEIEVTVEEGETGEQQHDIKLSKE